MTKDEARKELLAAIRYVAGGLIHPQEAMEIADAYAQAHTDAALADTLGMLEALAKRYGFAQTFIAKWDYLQVHWAGANFLYSGEDGEPEISRAEVEALLGDHPHG